MKLNIKGTIIPNSSKWIYDLFEMDSCCPNDVISAIEQSGGDLDVYINSGGGSIFAGSEIYAALRECKNVRIHIVGLAGSAASVIACAGKSDITPTGMVMIHNVSGSASGDHNDMTKMAGTLKTCSRALATAYIEKTGKSEKEIMSLMDKETWFTAQEAVDYGLIDNITEADTGMKLVAAIFEPVIPHAVEEKTRCLLNDVEKLKAENRLLKLGGK